MDADRYVFTDVYGVCTDLYLSWPMCVLEFPIQSTSRKTNMSLKKGTISIGNTYSNHWFSGDMLVFGCVLVHDVCLTFLQCWAGSLLICISIYLNCWLITYHPFWTVQNSFILIGFSSKCPCFWKGPSEFFRRPGKAFPKTNAGQPTPP